MIFFKCTKYLDLARIIIMKSADDVPQQSGVPLRLEMPRYKTAKIANAWQDVQALDETDAGVMGGLPI